MALQLPALLTRAVNTTTTSTTSNSYQITILAILAFGLALHVLRLRLLPKPIPGIPHNPEALRSLLGDVMAIQREMPDNIAEWVVRQGARHRSPVYQVFLVPLARPFVVVSDFREGQDIMVRRRDEFERSDLAIALLRGELPGFHACLKTGPAWSAHRRLLRDLMAPPFLHGVAAPNMYASACRLLQLWRAKVDIAGTGRPFAAHHDLRFSTLDAIYDFGYGDGAADRALLAQLALYNSMDKVAINRLHESTAPGEAIDFPPAPLDPAMDAVLRTTENITKVAVTGFPAMAWRVLAYIPKVRRLRKLKDDFIKGQVDKAVSRLNRSNLEDGDSKLKCALDLILQRERTLAAKEGREPIYWSEAIRDEMFGFVTAGHETTGTVLSWAVKYLADHPSHQDALRAHLRAAHPAAAARRRLPSHGEITSAHIPFLSAYVEEVLRLSHTTAMQDRQCTRDTVVLGHPIPKGTTVVVVNKGPGFTAPSLPIDESRRSETCQRAYRHGQGDPPAHYRTLDEDGMAEFDPRRWLVRSAETGEDEFDATAWPSIPFGLGQRGCFGKKMAYLQFRMLLTLLVWEFEFLKCPGELSTYDSVQILTNQPRKCYVALKAL